MNYLDMTGKKVPEVTFRTIEAGEWRDIHSGDLFNDRTVVVFSLPGAFTPTCSSSHVPRFNELAPVFAQAGVDEIMCVSVNDGFVMDAWKRDQDAGRIRFLPDGNGDFTRGMDMLVDKSSLGFGPRSWRYAMVVRDGVIDKMFVEPDKPGDPFEVSDADTVLGYLTPDRMLPPEITLFTKPGCGYCARAKSMLREASLDYEEIVLGGGISTSSLRAVSGRDTVPQVYIDGAHIGGSEDLAEWLAERSQDKAA